MKYSRADRVGENIQREIARLVREEVKDPRIGMVTFSHVQVTNDLGMAKVYYTVYGDEEQRKATQTGLTRSAGFIRRELGKGLHMRVIPELVFIYDVSLDHAHKINTLLKEVERVDAARNREAAGETELPPVVLRPEDDEEDEFEDEEDEFEDDDDDDDVDDDDDDDGDDDDDDDDEDERRHD